MKQNEMLRRIPLFDCLNSQELDELAGLFREVSFLKGETICREGEVEDSLHIIVSGELEVWAGRGKEKRVINRMGPGRFFGEIALLTGDVRTATVTVVRDARLLTIDRQAFDSFFRKNLHEAKDMTSLKKALSRGGFVRCGFCSTGIEGVPCAERIKDDLHGDVRGERADKREPPKGKCVVCGKPAKHVVYIGKQY